MRPPVLLVGVSGPDGSGKSSTVRGLAAGPWEADAHVRTAYLYGCTLCRRVPAAPHRLAADGAGRGLSALARSLHALVDVAEARLRLTLLLARARLSGGPQVVVTDRSPLDGLVKHRGDRRAGAAYARLAARYARIVLLDAPADVLAARDGEHGAAELERLRGEYARAAARLSNVVRAEPGRPVEELLLPVTARRGAALSGGGRS